VVAEERAAFGYLPSQDLDGEVFDLVHLRIHAPARGVRVPPLRADGDASRREPASVEPGSEERLGLAVRARRVEVTNPAGVGRVEHLVRLTLERGGVLLVTDIAPMADVDVAGTAERGEAEAERADRQAGPAEDPLAQLLRTKSIATGTPCSSKRSRSWFSTQ